MRNHDQRTDHRSCGRLSTSVAGDGCNNIEPGQVTTVDKVLANRSRARVPQFAMASQMQSEHTSRSETATLSPDHAPSSATRRPACGWASRLPTLRTIRTTLTVCLEGTTNSCPNDYHNDDPDDHDDYGYNYDHDATTPAPRIVVATTTPAPITRPHRDESLPFLTNSSA
ncbi:hypothetical protein BV898_15707 [Hypsibius exemplaris]|uniref:Uncharacterized protein n=1 Tax=Hypsibius exemplaris TaxID=2072580 RepID=A0A9X6NBN9_HYPEX|nr:hypothetical protein BV898_15707 [Hypsibius exemplaris]